MVMNPRRVQRKSNPQKRTTGAYFYNLALLMGGVMEDPKFHPEIILTIYANTLREAKQKWARVTNHLDKDWNEENQTYWGWSVICLGSDDSSVEIHKTL